MKTLTVDEVGLSKAIQRYLEDKGYYVHKIEMKLDHATNTFSASVIVED